MKTTLRGGLDRRLLSGPISSTPLVLDTEQGTFPVDHLLREFIGRQVVITIEEAPSAEEAPRATE